MFTCQMLIGTKAREMQEDEKKRKRKIKQKKQ